MAMMADNIFLKITSVPGYYVMQLVDDLVPASEGPTDAIVRGNTFEMGIVLNFKKGSIDFHGNKYPAISKYIGDTWTKSQGVTGHDNFLKAGAPYFPGDTVDSNLDLTTLPTGSPPVTPPVVPPIPPVDPCQAKVDAAVTPLQAQVAQLTADAAMLTSQVTTLQATIDEAEKVLAGW